MTAAANAQDSTAIERVPAQTPGPIELIQQAIRQGTPPEVIRELVALQQSMERFGWEREERQAKIDFDNALNSCQQQIGRIAPNQKRENGIIWADYAQVDKVVRPIYIAAGFSIGFSESDATNPNIMRMRATVSRGGISRDYFSDISRVPTNSKMNPVDAGASAASRVKRYLLLDIFNIAIGIDKDEKKPYEELEVTVYAPLLEAIENAQSVGAVTAAYISALKVAKTEGEKQSFENAAKKRKGELSR
jgi:hypothetical protein